jgi:hypothetical protein
MLILLRSTTNKHQFFVEKQIFLGNYQQISDSMSVVVWALVVSSARCVRFPGLGWKVLKSNRILCYYGGRSVQEHNL